MGGFSHSMAHFVSLMRDTYTNRAAMQYIRALNWLVLEFGVLDMQYGQITPSQAGCQWPSALISALGSPMRLKIVDGVIHVAILP